MSESPLIDEDLLLTEVYALLDGSAVGTRLRQGLGRSYWARERALRGAIPRHIRAHEFFQQQNTIYEKNCNEILGRVRNLLHTVVDRLVDDLHTQAVTDGGAALVAGLEKNDEPAAAPERSRSHDNASAAGEPQSSATMAASSAKEPLRTTAAATPNSLPVRPILLDDAIGPSRTGRLRHSDIGPGSNFIAVNGPSRSSRGWPLEHESPPAGDATTRGQRTALPVNSAANPVGSAAKRKRRVEWRGERREQFDDTSSEDSIDMTPKRNRRTSYSRTRRHAATSMIAYEDGYLCPNQPAIRLENVKGGECVFGYPGAMPGRFFVLRCTRRQCRPNREQMAQVEDVLIFTAYPFSYKRAEKHFKGSGHKIDSANADEVFCAFACEVTDAVQELNMEANKRGAKAQPRISMDMDGDRNMSDAAADGAGATAAASATPPSSRPHRASGSTSPRHPRSRAAVAHSRDSSRSRSRSRYEVPPSDPSLLFTPADVEDKNEGKNEGKNQGKHVAKNMDNSDEAKTDEEKPDGGNKHGFTRAGFVAPDDYPDDPNDDEALDSAYAPSSNAASSLEQDAAAALAAVQQQRARTSLRRDASDGHEDIEDVRDTTRHRRKDGEDWNY